MRAVLDRVRVRVRVGVRVHRPSVYSASIGTAVRRGGCCSWEEMLIVGGGVVVISVRLPGEVSEQFMRRCSVLK